MIIKNNQLQQTKHQFGKTKIKESNTDHLQTSPTVCNKSRKTKPKQKNNVTDCNKGINKTK